jgi:hypothetical protein
MLIRLAILICFTACASKPAPTTTPPGGSQASGTLSGTVSFVGTPCPEAKGPPCDGAYPDYEVVVYAKDGQTVAGKVKTGADGKFSLDLPAGDYVIVTPAGMTPDATKRTEVKISRDALSSVTLTVDTGVR